MSAVRKPGLITVEDYLAGELSSPIKHEYVAGRVYAMAGARVLHNRIVTRILKLLAVALEGKPCEPFGSDMKIRIRRPHTRFYYPDVHVVCQSTPDESSFQDEPAIVCEVLSERTRRLDEGEKKDAYLTLTSLAAYLLVEQGSPQIIVYRRKGSDFHREIYEGVDAIIQLPEIGAQLPLSQVYHGLTLTVDED